MLARARGVDWARCSMAELRSLSVDQCEFLAQLPHEWQASEASSLICDRPEWPLLVSVYTCSWREGAEAMPLALPMLAKAVYSGETMTMIAAFRRLHRCAPHPRTLPDMLTEVSLTGSTRRLSGAREEADINDYEGL